MPALLRARALTKRFGAVVALNDVDFEIAEAVTGLLGPNGAGKSTAIRLFLGLLEPTEGAAEVLGESAAATSVFESRLGYMPEHDCLPHDVSAAEFLAHMAEVSGLPRGQRGPAPPTRCATSACSRSATGRSGGTRPGCGSA